MIHCRLVAAVGIFWWPKEVCLLISFLQLPSLLLTTLPLNETSRTLIKNYHFIFFYEGRIQ